MRAGRIVTTVLLVLPAGLLAGGSAEHPEPNQNGPLQLKTASWLGGPESDELVGVVVTADGAVVLAGNGADYQPAGVQAVTLGEPADVPEGTQPPAEARKGRPKGNDPAPAAGSGFLARLDASGTKVEWLARFPAGAVTLRKLKRDGKGNVYVLGESRAGLALAGVSGRSTFVARLGGDGTRATAVRFHAGAIDFDVDADGELVILSKAKITRYGPGGAVKWTATWKAYGDNRPGAVAVVPQSGITAVVGYGMTHTGKEPYKDPYAYGFDRAGQQVWALWNPEPGRQKGTAYGGNGLMADTAGHGAVATPAGKLLLTFFADGGNSVCTRDPADPDRKLAAEVFAGVHQGHPGHGFRGATNTSVVFRVDPATGRLEKGTWFTAAEGVYKGGGFLAAFDADFRLLQSGYFPGSSMSAVAVGAGRIAVAGAAPRHENEKTRAAVPTYRPLQKEYGGGARDGYFALFRPGKE